MAEGNINDFDFSFLPTSNNLNQIQRTNHINHNSLNTPNTSQSARNNTRNMATSDDDSNDSLDDDVDNSPEDELQKALRESKSEYEANQLREFSEEDIQFQKIIRESLMNQDNDREIMLALQESEKQYKLEQARMLKQQQDEEYAYSLLQDQMKQLSMSSSIAKPTDQTETATSVNPTQSPNLMNTDNLTEEKRKLREARLKYFQNKS